VVKSYLGHSVQQWLFNIGSRLHLQQCPGYIALQTWSDNQAAALPNLQFDIYKQLSLSEAIATAQWVWQISELSFDECWDDMPRQGQQGSQSLIAAVPGM